MNDLNGKKLRWATVGAGQIAHKFAQDIQLAENAELSAVYARSKAAAEYFAKTHHIARNFDDLETLLQQSDIDAIYIATPNATHFDIAKRALTAQKSVLAEKPITSNLTHLKALNEIAKAKQLFLMEAMWTRFLPAIHDVRDRAISPHIGAIKRLSCELSFGHAYADDNHFFDPAHGGCLRDLGVYGLSLGSFLFGKPDITHCTIQHAPNGADLSAQLQLNFSGIPADMTFGLDYERANQFIIEAEHETIILSAPFNGCQRVSCYPNRLVAQFASLKGGGIMPRVIRKLIQKMPLPGVEHRCFPFHGHGLHFQISAASRAILKGDLESDVMPLKASLETLALIEQSLSSTQTRQSH